MACSVAVAALLLAAASPSGAGAAPKFTAAAYPATVIGTATGLHSFGLGEAKVTCGEAIFLGELFFASLEVQLEAFYEECEALGGALAEVDMNGCEYVPNNPALVAKDHYASQVEIACPKGQKIEIDTKVGGVVVCRAKIGEQFNLGKVDIVNHPEFFPAEDMTVQMEVKGIAGEAAGGGCPKQGAFNNGLYFGTSTVQANKENLFIAAMVE